MKRLAIFSVLLLVSCQSKPNLMGTWYGALPGMKLDLRADQSAVFTASTQDTGTQTGTYEVKGEEIVLSNLNVATRATVNNNELVLNTSRFNIPFRRKDTFTEEERQKVFGVSTNLLVGQLEQARTQAQHRALTVYSQNVYKVMLAYNADTQKDPLSGSCLNGYSAGDYSAETPPSSIPLSSCTVSWSVGAIDGTVEVVASDGFRVSLP